MNVDFKVMDFFKLPTTIMIAIVIASGFFLFLPDSIAQKAYFLNFRVEYGFILGIIFLISASILIVNLIYLFAKFLSNRYYKKRFYANAESNLMKLNDYQKSVIYLLYSQHNRTHELPIFDGAIKELESKLMIAKATNQYITYDFENAVFPYYLQPWVSNELNKSMKLKSEFSSVFHKFDFESY